MSADLRTILKSLKSTLEADSPAVSQYLPYVEAALTADAARAQGAIQVLDWANFDEIKLNREWLPDDQELIYTAINAYNGEGDMDDDCLEQIIERLLLAWRRAEAARAQGAEVHPDDLAVDRFAAAMKAKLAQKREEGRGGWDNPDECTVEFLSELLRDHVVKGDPVDVGNFAMMIHQREGRISRVLAATSGGHAPPSRPSGQKRIPMIKSKLSASQQKARDALAGGEA